MWIQEKYILLAGNRMTLFKKKGKNLFNCRCPECGDSHKNKFKARGYFYLHKGEYQYKCHNCGYSVKLATFLKKFTPDLYSDYTLELISEGENKAELKAPVDNKPSIRYNGLGPLAQLPKISQLHHTHFAKQYIDSRQLPTPMHAELRYCDDFVGFTNNILPDKLPVLDTKDRRVIVPLYTRAGAAYGYQGRSLDGSKSKYITIIFNDQGNRLYGLNRFDPERRVYIVEGAFDSMFVQNGLAVCGADMLTSAAYLVSEYNMDPKDVTVVYDNEPRSSIITKKVRDVIDLGYSVVIWPSFVDDKDINNMVLSGMTPADLKVVLEGNTYQGLHAQLAFSQWSRV